MTPRTIFISYSHRDTAYKDEIRNKLKIWERQNELAVEIWSDDDIPGGATWSGEIEQALERSDLAILVVTDNFLTSTFIMDKELPRLAGKRDHGELVIYPIVAEPCNWEASQFLKSLQMNPRWRPELCLPEPNSFRRKDDMTRIAREIKELLDKPVPESIVAPPPATEAPTSDPRGYPELEIGLYHHAFEVYQLEVRFGQLEKIENNRLHRKCIRLSRETLIGSADQVGMQLGRLLFGDPDAYAILDYSRNHVKDENTCLLLRVCIGANAQELCTVPWETLRDPQKKDFLALAPDVRFSRYLFGDSIATLKASTAYHEDERKSIVMPARVFTSPENFSDPTGPYFDEKGTFARERLSLLTDDVIAYDGETIADWREITDRLNACDVLYVINCAFTRADSTSWPTDREGRCQTCCGKDLVKELGRLTGLPRLVILEPPFEEATGARTAGIDYEALIENVVAAANQGIIGVLAPQANITKKNWKQFLDTFLDILRKRGNMTEAMSAARKRIDGEDDWWVPVLLSRRKSGYLWYQIGFESSEIGEKKWKALLNNIKNNECLPILGPGVIQPYVGSRQYIAKTLSDRYYFPMAFHDRTNLRQVTQYLEVELYYRNEMIDSIQKEYAAHIGEIYKKKLNKSPQEIARMSLDDLIKEIARHHMQNDPKNPHRLLAEIPFQLYLTSNLASVMSLALEEMAHRKPIEQAYTPKVNFSYDHKPLAPLKLSRETPVVYHLFGRLSDDPDNITLTENDYFEFLINFTKERNIPANFRRVPEAIYGQLTGSTLLFLGFNVREWDFQLIYRIWKALEGSEYISRRPNVAVQIDPDEDFAIDPKRARKYLERWFGVATGGRKTEVNIYWGTTKDFIADLHGRVKTAFPEEMFIV